MPRDRKNKTPAAPPPPPPAASVTPVAAAAGNPSMAPRGQFNRRQEGQRFLTPLQSIAANPRNLREEWEYATEEFEEFAKNVENTELIQDPAVCSVAAFTAKYPAHATAFASEVEWVLLAGERRYRALLEAKARTESVAVVLRDTLLEKGDFVLLSENNFRKGWDPIQEAVLLKRIKSEEGLTYDEILEKLGGEQTAIKRRPDISKRIKLLELEDGPLRRAIREGQIGLEPAYTLVSRLKESELIEQGWALMQSDAVTAKAACDALLGKAQTPVQEASEVGSAATPASGLPTASALSGNEDQGTTGTGQEADGPAAGEDEQQLSKERAGGPTPLPAVVLPTAPAGFVDETSGTNDIRVPNQQGPSSEPAPVDTPRAAAGADKPTEVDGSNNEREVNARLQACRKILASATWQSPDFTARAVARHVLLEAPTDALDLATQIADHVGLTDGARFRYVAALEAADDSGILAMAFAVALASDELHLRSVGDHLDARAADYLKHLHAGAGYDITGS